MSPFSAGMIFKICLLIVLTWLITLPTITMSHNYNNVITLVVVGLTLLSLLGQFAQSVYPSSSGKNPAFRTGMRLLDNSSYATTAARDQLYAEWRRLWQPHNHTILIEKSPRHSLMTRLLQYWFTPERTYFVVMLRHPLGTMRGDANVIVAATKLPQVILTF